MSRKKIWRQCIHCGGRHAYFRVITSDFRCMDCRKTFSRKDTLKTFGWMHGDTLIEKVWWNPLTWF
jgi:transposase-like protein